MPSENLKIISVQMPLSINARLEALRARLQAADPNRAASRSEAIRHCIEAIICIEEAAIGTGLCKQETKVA